MESYYANLISYRVTVNELVLEFGNFFPGQDDRSSYQFSDFDIRVVMIPDMIEPIMKLLEQARTARDLQRKTLLDKQEQGAKAQ